MTGELTTGWDCIIVAPLDSAGAVAVRTGGKTLLHICSTVPEWTRSAVQEYTLRVQRNRTPTLRRRLRGVVWGVVDRLPYTCRRAYFRHRWPCLPGRLDP